MPPRAPRLPAPKARKPRTTKVKPETWAIEAAALRERLGEAREQLRIELATYHGPECNKDTCATARLIHELTPGKDDKEATTP